MMQTMGFNLGQGLDDPLLLGLNKLMNSMFRDPGWSDNFDFAQRYDDSHLRGAGTAPDMVGKG